jgi:hypothetical protein
LKLAKNTKVIWRVTSGFCTLEWKGVVTASRKNKSYVLFDGGGHWIENEYLTVTE